MNNFNLIIWISLGVTYVSMLLIFALKPTEKITLNQEFWNQPQKPLVTPQQRIEAPLLDKPPMLLREKQLTYRAAIEKAKRESKLVVVFFTSVSCGWCKKMKAEVFTSAEVKAALQKYIWVEVDIEIDEKTRDQWGVEALPTHLIVNSDEKRIKSRVGWMTAAEYSIWIK